MNHPMKKLFLVSLLSALPYSSYATDYDAQTNQLLQLAADTELANAETRAANAKFEAIRAKQQLTAPTLSQNAIDRTTQGAPTHRDIKRASPIDSVELKSLVTTSGITTAWIALEGEMIEVKKGSQVGALKVIELDENSVFFSDGKQTKRKWMAGFKAKAKPQSTTIRGGNNG